MQFLFLILGLIGLWLGATLVVRGAQDIARFFGISEFFIGLTAVSIGTSLPEISVSVAGGIKRLSGIETSGLVIGDKIGSCLSHITLVLGIVALFGILTITKRQLKLDGAMVLGSIIVFFLMAWDLEITRIEALILILFYIIYFLFLFRDEGLCKKLASTRPQLNLLWNIIFLAGGLGLLIYSTNTVLKSGIYVADLWGVPESTIGILIVGFGGGLPELAVSLQAIKKNSIALSVSNLLGSNICDILFSLGLGAVISGFVVEPGLLMFEIPLLFFVSLLALFFFRTKLKLSKWEAGALAAVFIGYVMVKIMMVV